MKRSLLLMSVILLCYNMVSCEKTTNETEIPRSSAKEIVSINFYKINNAYLSEDVVAEKSSGEFKANLPQGMSLTNLTPVVVVSEKAKVIYAGDTYDSFPDGIQLHGDFSKPVEITVVAEDETRAKYKLTVVSEPFSGEKKLLSLLIKADNNNSISKDIVGQVSGNTVRFTVPVGTEANVYADIKISDFAKLIDLDNQVLDTEKPIKIFAVEQRNGNEVKRILKIQAQDKSVQEIEIIINTEKGKPQDIFDNSNSSRLSSIFFVTGMDDAEIAYIVSPMYVTFQYNVQGKIEKIRYYLHHTMDNGYKYFSYVGMDKYLYKESSVEITKLSVFYDYQDFANLIAEIGSNGYPKSIKYKFSTDGNTFYSNYVYNDNGNLTSAEGQGSMFDAGTVFEDLTKIPFKNKFEYTNGNLTKLISGDGSYESYSYYTDKNSNDSWAQGLISLGTDARKYGYIVNPGKPSKNLLKQIYDPTYETFTNYTYKFDSSNRVSEMNVTSTANDSPGTVDRPAIIQFNYAK